MSNPDDSASHEEQRPQPRYGAYAPQGQGPSEPTENPSPGGTDSPYGGQHNPYDQPTWGHPGGQSAPPYGNANPYGPSPYGEQQTSTQPVWGQPGQPGGQQPGPQPHPAAQTTQTIQKPKRPLTLVLAMVLMLVAGGLSLAWGFYAMAALQSLNPEAFMTEQTRELLISSMEDDPALEDVSPEELLETGMVMVGMFALMWAAVLLALYITMAFVGTMTGNVGRVLATIWLAGSLLFLFLSVDDTSLLIIVATVLTSLAALTLLWLPPSNAYVRQRRAFKEAQRSVPFSGYPGGP